MFGEQLTSDALPTPDKSRYRRCEVALHLSGLCVNQELSDRPHGVRSVCSPADTALDFSYEGFLRLSGRRSIWVSNFDDGPSRPRDSPAVKSRRPNYICDLWGSSRTTGFGPSNHQCLERACSGIPAEQETPLGHLVCRRRYPCLLELSALAHFREIAALVLRHVTVHLLLARFHLSGLCVYQDLAQLVAELIPSLFVVDEL